jgi:hypothetical protein
MEIAVIVLGLIGIWLVWDFVSKLLTAGEAEVDVLIDTRKVDHAEAYAKIDKDLTDAKVKAAKSGKAKLASLDI